MRRVVLELFLLSLFSGTSGTATVNFTLVIIGLRGTVNPADMRICGPGMDLAVAEIRQRYPVMRFLRAEVWKQPFLTSCDSLEANIADAAAKTYYGKLASSHPVSVFVGTGCAYADKQLLDLLRYWNVTFIDGSSIGAFLSDRKKYPMVVGFSYNQLRAGEFFYQVTRHYNWTKVTALYDVDDAIWRGMYTSMDYFKNKQSVQLQPVYLQLTNVSQSLLEAHAQSRISIVLATPTVLRDIMIAAHRLGYTTGDHVYLAVAYFKTKYYFGMPEWRQNSSTDQEAKAAFQSLFLVREYVMESDKFRRFAETVEIWSQRNFNQSIEPDDEVNVHATAFYDAVVTYGHVVNEAISDNHNIFDGRQMLRRFSNRTFPGIRGNFTMGAQNEVPGHFELWNFRSATGLFEKVIDFPDEAVAINVVRTVEWTSSYGPPPSQPFCWFDGNNPTCQEAHNYNHMEILYWTLLIVGIALCIANVLWAAYRRRKQRQSNLDLAGWRLSTQCFYMYDLNNR